MPELNKNHWGKLCKEKTGMTRREFEKQFMQEWSPELFVIRETDFLEMESKISQLEQESAELKTCEPNTLTKREQFAMSAMQGLLSNIRVTRHNEFDDGDIDTVIGTARYMADALIKELEK